MKKRRVVITGIGLVSPLGFNKDEVWNSLVGRKISLKKEQYFVNENEKWGEFLAHKICGFDINKFNMDKDELRYVNDWKKGYDSKILNYLLAAVKLSIDDSSLVYSKDDNDIGCFLTIEHPDFENFCEGLILDSIKESIQAQENKKSSLVETLEKVYKNNESKGYDLHSFMYLYFIAKVFGLHGYSLFTNNACASGLYTLELAAQQILLGNSSIALAAAGEAGINIYKYRWFKDREIYADDGHIKPFSNQADGLVLGEGASALILEEYEHAKNRGANIYCEYLGGGFSLESWKVIYPDVSKKHYNKCILDAIERSAISKDDIDVINPHGVGMKITDLYEARAISDVFSKRKDYSVTALKPYVGHNLGGSALIESIILILMMQNNKILPTLNCEMPITEIERNLSKELIEKEIKVAMKTSCGFAGYNGATVFRKL